MELSSAIAESVQLLGLDSLKEKQSEAVSAFVSGNDTFVSLPTGYGKSIIYAILPLVFDKFKGAVTIEISGCSLIVSFLSGTSGSIVVCVSPLTSIMMDQRTKFTPMNLCTEFVGEQQTDRSAEIRVCNGEVQLVLISPESLIEVPKYRNMLLSKAYQEKLVALVVDEAHCVKKRGDRFRTAFVQIGELRSIK